MKEMESPLRWQDALKWVVGPRVDGTHPSGILVPAFTVTQEELGILARHYIGDMESTMMSCRYVGDFGTSDHGVCNYDHLRLQNIRLALGKELYDEAVADTEGKWHEEWEEFVPLEADFPGTSDGTVL